MTALLLAINHFSVAFRQGENLRQVVDDVSLRIEAGKTLARVSGSGSGKSVTALSVMRLLHPSHRRLSWR